MHTISLRSDYTILFNKLIAIVFLFLQQNKNHIRKTEFLAHDTDTRTYIEDMKGAIVFHPCYYTLKIIVCVSQKATFRWTSYISIDMFLCRTCTTSEVPE